MGKRVVWGVLIVKGEGVNKNSNCGGRGVMGELADLILIIGVKMQKIWLGGGDMKAKNI